MKEFTVKHPFITFLIVDTVVAGIVAVVKILKFSGSGGNND